MTIRPTAAMQSRALGAPVSAGSDFQRTAQLRWALKAQAMMGTAIAAEYLRADGWTLADALALLIGKEAR